jgi:hypothetical protein
VDTLDKPWFLPQLALLVQIREVTPRVLQPLLLAQYVKSPLLGLPGFSLPLLGESTKVPELQPGPVDLRGSTQGYVWVDLAVISEDLVVGHTYSQLVHVGLPVPVDLVSLLVRQR